jgi:hypothetical protein
VLLGLLIGLLAGLLVFGTAGFFTGRWTADRSTPTPTPSTSPATTPASAGSSLPPYEQSQLAINRGRFSGELATFAGGWLPYVGDCVKSGDRGGPDLAAGEVVRVGCEYGNLSVYFIQYTSIAARDKTRIRNLGQNVDARQLTPGVAPGTDRPTPSGRSEGSYIEYAYRVGQGDAFRTVAGIWWDDADTPVGAYLVAYWKEGAGESWAPMRDVWSRHA